MGLQRGEFSPLTQKLWHMKEQATFCWIMFTNVLDFQTALSLTKILGSPLNHSRNSLNSWESNKNWWQPIIPKAMEPQNTSIKKSKHTLEFTAHRTPKLGTNLLELWNLLTTIDDIPTDKGCHLNSCIDSPLLQSQLRSKTQNSLLWTTRSNNSKMIKKKH